MASIPSPRKISPYTSMIIVADHQTDHNPYFYRPNNNNDDDKNNILHNINYYIPIRD